MNIQSVVELYTNTSVCLSSDMHEMPITYEKCLGAYCGRTVDEFGNFSSCSVSFHADHYPSYYASSASKPAELDIGL